jgi:hypothetical protein
MSYSAEDVAELKMLCPEAAEGMEGSTPVLVLPSLVLPAGCVPPVVDALLWLASRDGYPSRLYLSQRVVKPGAQPNWNSDIRILERNWHAYSWNLNRTDLRPMQMIAEHLRGLQ